MIGMAAREALRARVGFIAPETFDDPTGIGTYTRQLADRLPRRVDGFCCVRDVSNECEGASEHTLLLPPFLRSKLMRRFATPLYLTSRKFDLLHFPTEMSLFLVPFGAARIVVTVHGLASIRLPAELHERLPRRARCSPSPIISSRSDRFVSKRWVCEMSASTSYGSTNRAASPATSGIEKAVDVMTGQPEAIASTIGMPKPSWKDGKMSASAAR